MAQAINVDWGWPQLEDLLLCPVCYDVPMGPIKTCEHGHHTCVSCRKKLERCPMCKCVLVDTRNYVMEEIIANLQSIKQLMTNGVVPRSSRDRVEDDGAGSKKRKRTLAAPPQSRGLFPCRIVGCQERLPVSRMLNHIRYHHRDSLHEGKLNDDSDMYTQMWEINYETCEKINAIKVEKMGVFFLIVHILENKDVRIFLQMVASHTHAQQFMYTIRLSGDLTNTYHVGKVMSCREPFNQVVGRKCCLTLLAEAMKNVCVFNTNFRCHISIRYIGPPSNTPETSRQDTRT